MAGGANFGFPGGPIPLEDQEPFNTYDLAVKTYGVQVGQYGRTRDGREWTFVTAGGSALAPGKVAADTAPISTSVGLTAAAAAVGATSITATVGAATIAANYYKGGFLVIEDGPGEGQVFNIKSHAAAAGSDAVIFYLAESQAVAVALTTSSKVSLYLPSGAVGIIAASPAVTRILGVPVVSIPAGDSGWVCRKGLVAVLEDTTVVAGNTVVMSPTVDGAVAPMTTTQAVTEQPLGVCVRSGGNTNYATVFFQLPG